MSTEEKHYCRGWGTCSRCKLRRGPSQLREILEHGKWIIVCRDGAECRRWAENKPAPTPPPKVDVFADFVPPVREDDDQNVKRAPTPAIDSRGVQDAKPKRPRSRRGR